MNRTQLIFEFIVGYKLKFDGNSPSLREIVDKFNTSTSVVNHHLQKLEIAGLIARPKRDGTAARFIVVNGGCWIPPEDESD